MAMAAWAVPLALQVVGTIKQGQADAANQENAAKIGDYNATVDQQNADAALQAANANEETQRRKDAMDRGAQIASLAENGMDITSGTGYDLVQQSTINSELNALNVRYAGLTQSRQYEQQATLDRYGANTYRVNAGNIQQAATLSAGSRALTGVSRYISSQSQSGQYQNY